MHPLHFMSASALGVTGGSESIIYSIAKTISTEPKHLIAGSARLSLPYFKSVFDSITKVPYVKRDSRLCGVAIRLGRMLRQPLSPLRLESHTFFTAASRTPRVKSSVSKARLVSLHLDVDLLIFRRFWRRTPVVWHVPRVSEDVAAALKERSEALEGVRLLSNSPAYRAEMESLLDMSVGLAPPFLNPDLEQANLRWQLPKASPRQLSLVWAARLDPPKMPGKAIHVVRGLADRGVECTLSIYGDGRLRGEVLEEAQRLRVHDRVHVHGVVPQHEVWEAMAHADAVLHVTQEETFCLTVLEALWLGTPVFASDVAGLHWAVPAVTLLPNTEIGNWVDALARRGTSTEGHASERRKLARRFTWSSVSEVYVSNWLR